MTNPVATYISKRARAVLVFPNIVKASLGFGSRYGKGILTKGAAVAGYYNSVSAPGSLHMSTQSFGYMMFLMNNRATRHLERSSAWVIGVGPRVVVLDSSIVGDLSMSMLNDDAYAFIFDQQGLMASHSIEGARISRI
jgi:lipid-binding SYLF domain-containing protein